MWQKVNNSYFNFLFLLIVFGFPNNIWSASNLGIRSSVEYKETNQGVIVLDSRKSFAEQLVHENSIYEIRRDFDLRQEVKNLQLYTSVYINNKKYYRNTTLIKLNANQGLWVPDGILIISKSNEILSKIGYYISEVSEVVYLCSQKTEIIDYKISGIVTMPAGCVLKFEGGKLSNGIIRSVRTRIQAPPIKIFGDNMFFDWYWDGVEAYPEWFGAKGIKNADDGYAIQKCLDSFKKAILTNHEYYSASSIYIPSHGRITGLGRYQTSIIFTTSLEHMFFSSNDKTTTEFVLSNVNLVKSSDSVSIKYGLDIYSSTGSRIENVSISGTEVGFALNSYFGSHIKGCKAYNCNIGFYLGSGGGNSTSVDYDNCYANKCKTGHMFRRCSYVTTKNTSADFCETAYDFVESCITMISPGAERCKFFATLIPHKEISKVGNYHSNSIHIINGQSIANEYNNMGIIYISTETRGYNDRNRIVIDGFNVYFKMRSCDNKLLFKAGDSVLQLNDLTADVLPDIESINYYRDGVAVVQSLSTLKFWSDKIVGTSVFVKKINKPLFWDGSSWVDAAGEIIYR